MGLLKSMEEQSKVEDDDLHEEEFLYLDIPVIVQ